MKRWQKQVKKAGKELLEAMESQAEQQDPEDEDPDSQEPEDQSVENLIDSLIVKLSTDLFLPSSHFLPWQTVILLNLVPFLRSICHANRNSPKLLSSQQMEGR